MTGKPQKPLDLLDLLRAELLARCPQPTATPARETAQ